MTEGDKAISYHGCSYNHEPINNPGKSPCQPRLTRGLFFCPQSAKQARPALMMR